MRYVVLKISHVESSIQRPEIFIHKKNFPNSSITSGDYPWPSDLRFRMVSCQARRRINRDETKNASLLREVIATFQLQNPTQRPDIPTFWSLPQRRIFKCIRKQCGGFNVHASRLTAFDLGANGVEVHEPRLEDRPRHRLQRLVHPPVQLDFVVQRAETMGDGALFTDI